MGQGGCFWPFFWNAPGSPAVKTNLILKYMGGMQQYDIFFCFFVVIVHSCRNGWFGDTCVTTRVSELWEKVERNSIAMIDETISLLFLFSELCSEKGCNWPQKRDFFIGMTGMIKKGKIQIRKIKKLTELTFYGFAADLAGSQACNVWIFYQNYFGGWFGLFM